MHHDRTGEYPWKPLRGLFDAGLLNLHVPASCGGLGLSSVDASLVTEELAYGCTGIQVFFFVRFFFLFFFYAQFLVFVDFLLFLFLFLFSLSFFFSSSLLLLLFSSQFQIRITREMGFKTLQRTYKPNSFPHHKKLPRLFGWAVYSTFSANFFPTFLLCKKPNQEEVGKLIFFLRLQRRPTDSRR